MDRGTNWSVTINNPTPDDEEAIAFARQKGWKVEGQLEQGSNGTPHYQLIVKTPQVRFAALKKQFPRAHIELARNAKALETYVQKDETRIGSLPTSQEAYPSLSRFWELLSDRLKPIEDFQYLDKKLRRLTQYDDAVNQLITEGYHVETLAMNPSTRSCWNNYAISILKRTETEKTARQNAAVAEKISSVSIPNAPEESSEESSPEGSPTGTEDEDDEEFSESEYTQI